jgi:hypothetical protein
VLAALLRTLLFERLPPGTLLAVHGGRGSLARLLELQVLPLLVCLAHLFCMPLFLAPCSLRSALLISFCFFVLCSDVLTSLFFAA